MLMKKNKIFYPDSDWKHLLKGGFCFGLSHFACHPLDKQRAVEMFYKTKVNNVSLKEILKEAKAYLKSKGYDNNADIAEKVKEVEEFYKEVDKPKSNFKKQAWLITWENKDSKSFNPNNIIAIRDARVSGEKIADFVTLHYAAIKYSSTNKFRFSSKATPNPYPAIFSKTDKGISYACDITCGDNPYIHARIVKNLKISYENNTEKFDWEEVDYKSWSL